MHIKRHVKHTSAIPLSRVHDLIIQRKTLHRQACACSCMVAEDSTADCKVPRSMALVQPMSFTMSPCNSTVVETSQAPNLSLPVTFT